MIEISNNEEYLTYLKKNRFPFDETKINTNIQNKSICLNKPRGAWWGSPINAEFGWKEWCLCNNFEIDNYDWENPIKWRLQEGSKILRIELLDVLDEEKSILNNYVYTDDRYKYLQLSILGRELDFNKILEGEIVAVELMDGSIGHRFINSLESMFYSWDCESIVVLDETKIEILEG